MPFATQALIFRPPARVVSAHTFISLELALHHGGRSIGRCRVEAHLAANTSGQGQLGVRQGQAHAESAAGSVKYAVDHSHHGRIATADWRLRPDRRLAAATHLAIVGGWHEHFGAQWVDLRKRQYRALLVAVFPGTSSRSTTTPSIGLRDVR